MKSKRLIVPTVALGIVGSFAAPAAAQYSSGNSTGSNSANSGAVNGNLAFTGSESETLALVGAITLASGATLAWAARRPRSEA